MPVDDKNFGADDYHTGNDQSYLKKLGLGDKSIERDKQQNSNSEDYQKFAGDNKPVLTYPQDLFKANQVNGVCFFVKVRNNSVASKGSSGPSGLAKDRIDAFRSTHSEMATQMNRSSVEQQAAVMRTGGALIAAAAVPGMVKNFTAAKSGFANKLKSLNPLSSASAATAAGAGVGILATEHARNKNESGFDNEAGQYSTGTKFLNKVIQLHVPQSIISQYQADWNETELGMAGILANKRFDQASLADVGEAAGRGLIQAAAGLPKALGVDADLGAAIEATSRKTTNPYKEQLFKSMGFRSFAFQYVFNPRNIEEYNDVRSIVNTFKYHMHPEISPGQAFLIYPSEFNIEFYHATDGGVKPNPHLPKISDCALKDVKVTYGPDGFFNTVAGTDGIPSEITLQLNFTELETMTANRIADGY